MLIKKHRPTIGPPYIPVTIVEGFFVPGDKSQAFRTYKQTDYSMQAILAENCSPSSEISPN
jgi:hypothetical protein